MISNKIIFFTEFFVRSPPKSWLTFNKTSFAFLRLVHFTFAETRFKYCQTAQRASAQEKYIVLQRLAETT